MEKGSVPIHAHSHVHTYTEYGLEATFIYFMMTFLPLAKPSACKKNVHLLVINYIFMHTEEYLFHGYFSKGSWPLMKSNKPPCDPVFTSITVLRTVKCGG